MRTVWKFPIEQVMEVPHLAKVVKVQWEFAREGTEHLGFVWFEVDTDATPVTNRFAVFGTGHPISPGHEHVDTIFDGPFVWHLYRFAEERF